MMQCATSHGLSPGSHSTLGISVEENKINTKESQFIEQETLAIQTYRRPLMFFASRDPMSGV